MGANPNNYDYGRNPFLYPKPFNGYEYKTVTASGTDYSLKDNTDLFSLISSPYSAIIKNSDVDILVKYNDVIYDSIPVKADTEFVSPGMMISDIFITVSGIATFDVMLLGWR